MLALIGCPNDDDLGSKNRWQEDDPKITHQDLPSTDNEPVASTVNASRIASDSITIGSNISLPGATERGVVYSTSPQPTTEDAKVVAPESGTGAFSVTVSGLMPSTTYYVRAYAMNAERVIYSEEQNFSTLAAEESPVENARLPALNTSGISNIGSISATLGGEIVDLGIPAYTERGVCYATTQNPTTANNKVVIPGSGTGTFSQNVSGLTLNTTYYVRAYAISAAGTVYGPQQSFTTSAEPIQQPPAAPSNLEATAVSSSQINLTWTNNATDATGYKVERSSDGNNWTEIAAALPANTTNYQSTQLAASSLYQHRVRAFNSAGNSAYSNVASATTQQDPPSAPSGLTATAASTSQINLFWTNNANNATGYMVERSANGGGSWTEIASTLSANTTNYQSTGLAAGTSYHYRVRAFNSAGNSGYSNVASATTIPAPITVNPVRSNSLRDRSQYPAEKNTSYPMETSSWIAVGNQQLQYWLIWPAESHDFQYSMQGAAIYFDIHSQIVGRNIRRAELRLHVSSYSDRSSNYYIAAFADSWNSNISWASGGNLRVYADTFIVQAPPSSSPWVVNVTRIVQDWANGSRPNYGLYLRDNDMFPIPIPARGVTTTVDRRTIFHNNHSSVAANLRPSLYVEFQ